VVRGEGNRGGTEKRRKGTMMRGRLKLDEKFVMQGRETEEKKEECIGRSIFDLI